MKAISKTNEIKNYGYKAPHIEADHYFFGSSPLSREDILPSGDWRPYLPVYEPQADKFETYGCTVWGSENQVETLIKFITGVEHNFDERFPYNIVEIEPPGTDPQLVYESNRKNGLTEGLFLMTETLEEFKKPRPIGDYLKEGMKFGYIIKHEWLFTNNPNKDNRLNLLRTGLKKCPIAVSVTAWQEDSQGLYIDNGQPNCHWCVCVALEGDSLIVFDSYDQSIKKLHPDHHIEVAKMIYLTEKKTEQLNLIQTIILFIKQTIGLIQEEVKTLPVKDNTYQELKDSLKDTMIQKWAKAIAQFEGSKTFLNNPGNLKLSPLTQSWGAKFGYSAVDGGVIAKFDTPEKGFTALCNFLTLGCRDELKAFHSARTLGQFMTVYAGNPPLAYINGIAKLLNVSLETDIKTFLTT